MIRNIPKHLKKYIVKQDYSTYSFIDQACWQFIMKISIDFFKKNADSIYISGLKQTGISIDKIPKIENINKKLSKFGWNAVCVRGFIPPQIFMEFQSLKILPIAADMRDHRNLTYTPAPDIVHEAAGHAPIIANKDYAQYLIDYGEIAIKAIMSSEDIELYYAIRDLSDIKENVNASKKEIKLCETNLKNAYNNISYTSESAMLARMNWWTVEYGLCGTKDNPKIYGAGLLSSVAESENCLTKKVEKLPFDLTCLNYKYDITEQQPQLFITPNYKYLSKILKKLSNKMSFKRGGKYGLDTAIRAKTLCTICFENDLKISGIVENYITKKNKIFFIKLAGPSQISYKDNQIKNHGPNYHIHGYSSPLGNISQYNKPISNLTKIQITKLNIKKNQFTSLQFSSGIKVSGYISNILKKENKIIIITFYECYVKYKSEILFKPDWGNYDLICASDIVSVFGGPADSKNYYLNSDKSQYAKYNKKNNKKQNSDLNKLFKKLFSIKKNSDINEYYEIYKAMQKKNISDWLIKYKLLEATNCNREINWINNLYIDLNKITIKNSDLSRAIKRGLNLFK